MQRSGIGLRRNVWHTALIGSLLLVGSVAAHDPIDFGYRDLWYPPGTGANSSPTGETPESKLWWNDGYWWGILWSGWGNAYHIFYLDPSTQEWIDTGTPVDDRPGSRADVGWDGQHLYVVSHIFSTTGQPAPPGERGELYRFSYEPGTLYYGYSLDPGFPVEVTGGTSETLVLGKDSTSQLWVTYVENNQVMVNHSLNGDDSAWGTPFILPVAQGDAVTQDDISSIIAFNGQIGVMWSDQDEPIRMNFAVHRDGPDPFSWQSTTVYSAFGDDHIKLKAMQSDSEGNVFAAIQTNTDDILLLVCRTHFSRCVERADWTVHQVYNGITDDEFDPTRPILLIDTDNRELYVFVNVKLSHETGQTAIYYKKAPIDNIRFPSGVGEPFIQSANDLAINNPTSTKQNLNSTTNLVVLASDETTNDYFHNYLVLNPPPVVTRVEDTNTAITYTPTGTWVLGNTDRTWSGGTAALGFAAGQRATLSFSGTGARWIAFQGPQSGIADIYLDGAHVSSVDAYASAETIGAVLYTASGLVPGTHTLVIEATGTKNELSTNFYVVVDAFEVLSDERP